MISILRQILHDVYDTARTGTGNLWDRNVGIAGLAMLVFNLVLSSGLEVFARKSFLESSRIGQMTAGGIDTSAAFPLALTDSALVGGAQIVTGAVGMIVVLVVLVRIFLDDEARIVDHLMGIVRPAIQALVMLAGISIAVLALVTVLAIPFRVLSQVAGREVLIVAVGMVLVGLFYVAASISMALPSLVENRSGIMTAIRTSVGLVRSNQGYLITALLTAAIINLLVGLVGQVAGSIYGPLHPLIPPLLQNLGTTVGLLTQWAILMEAYRRLNG